jgi:tetratricopeptide (TPR) repeat protein
MGRFGESIAEIRRAQDLDPLSLGAGRLMGIALFCAGHYDQAIEEQKKILDMNPNFTLVLMDLGRAYLQKGMYYEAIAEFQKAIVLSGDNPAASVMYRGNLGYAYAVSGNKTEALKLLEELKEESKQRYVSPLLIAEIYAGLGMKEQAFEWLEKAYGIRDGNMVLLKIWYSWHPLRSDPRFQDLLRRMNFPE